jgi:uncharacterized protein with PQ loop repeat
MNTLIGSLATAITISSFLFTDIKTIRIVNLLGCFIWLLYGWMQDDTPIILVNSIIAFIHIVTLVKQSLK